MTGVNPYSDLAEVAMAMDSLTQRNQIEPAHIAFEHDKAEAFGTLTQHREGTRSIYIDDSEGNIELLKAARTARTPVKG